MKVGERVPDFEGTDQHGNVVALSDLRAAGPVIVFFYPKAMTMGCTRQNCHFRDLSAQFSELDTTIVGVSSDGPDRQREFDDANNLGFALLADPERRIAKSFGVVRRGLLPNQRATFVIDRDATIIAKVHSETNMRIHAEKALASVQELQ